MAIKCWSYDIGYIAFTTPNTDFDVREWDLFLDQFCVAVRVSWNKYERDDVFDWLEIHPTGKWYVDKVKKVKSYDGKTHEYSEVYFEADEDAMAFKLRWL